MKNSEYWKQRQEAKYLKGERDLGEFHKDVIKSFERAKNNIHSVVNDFYIKYAMNNGLTYDVAMMELDFNELKDLKDNLEWFKSLALESIGEFNLELENMSMSARITRYQALEMQIDGILNNLYAIDYEKHGTDRLINIYKDQYYRTIFNIEQYRGFHSEFAQINNRAVEELINYPFSGASYSDRLWRQKDDLIFKLKDSIMDMIIKGTNPVELAEDFAKHFGAKEHEAYRLLQMEGAFIIEQATLKGYEEDGVEKYQILATLDVKTSDTCRNQDGKKYDVDKAVTGVNSPPFHWFCRTTTIPYLGDVDTWIDERIARDPETNKTYKVWADTTYPEWYEKYVRSKEDIPKYEAKVQTWIDEHKNNLNVNNQKITNKIGDKVQYNKYKEILGKEMPKSFDKFQELKYNDVNKWDFIKLDYQRQKKLIDDSSLKLPNADKVFIANEKFTGYLYNKANKIGDAKGKLFEDRLGYSATNYEMLKDEIIKRASQYPAIAKLTDEHGTRYEQKIIIYGLNDKPANVIVAWNVKGDVTKMTSTYIKEVK
jgi:SPP1 gp7 family putative phage head morphogenesis protein